MAPATVTEIRSPLYSPILLIVVVVSIESLPISGGIEIIVNGSALIIVSFESISTTLIVPIELKRPKVKELV